jgi:hypothetical protein
MTIASRWHKGETRVVSQDNTLQLKERHMKRWWRWGMKRWGMVGAQLLVLFMINLAHATGLGVQGDGFVTTFAAWIPTILFIAMLVGIAVWLQSSSDYNQGVLAGSVSLVSRGVIGGGAVGILAALGFAQGALLN